jgi:pimeloyl-ACP methyl ester carboxylesterase
MPRVAANGLDFHVQELGSGAPVVMLHGLLIGSLASWYFTAAPSLARTRRVRLYDLRGHGLSERPARGYDSRTMAADLDALTRDLDEPFDLVGHSWGALVALRFAIDHPARVRRLAIVEAPLPPSRFADESGFFASTPDQMVDALPEALKAAIAGGRRQAAKLLASLRFLAYDTTLLADLRAEGDLADDELGAIAAETLLLYGDRSSCRPAGERLARAIPAARLRVLDGGHYLHLDARAAVTDALEGLLGRAPERGRAEVRKDRAERTARERGREDPGETPEGAMK